MYLQTDLHEISTKNELADVISNDEKAVVVCGRMGPMCIPVYGIMESLRNKQIDTKFYSMGFDNPGASMIRNLPEASRFRGLPFTIYYRNGEVVKATSSIQGPKEVKTIIKEVFA